jgi:hypoxanthine-DNA glycosylase
MEHIIHPWKPIFDAKSRVLILGTIPSPRSRKEGFYFGHPQNVFWRTLAEVFESTIPENVEEKRAFLLKNHIALWDVLHACDIEGASDSSVKNPIPNKFRPLIEQSNIGTIFTTGRKATDLFNQCCAEESDIPAIYLPSTSPANRATQARPEFIELWMQVREAADKE